MSSDLQAPVSQPEGAPPCPFSYAGSSLYGYPCDDGATVDLLVVYTAAARDAAGGDAQIVNRINTAIAYANQAYVNSQIALELRLAHAELIAYTETGLVLVDLARLAEPADEFLDSVHALRDQHGGDIVSLWVNALDAGGAGYSLSALGSDDDGRAAFNVCRQADFAGETLAHECGHNFGCQHDRQTNPTGGFFNYSYGYREPGNVWKDIMAYPPGTTIQHFSNPNVSYNGPLGNPGPTGVPGDDPLTSCNNALTINNTRWTVANFRPSTLTAAPPSRLYVRPTAPPGGNGASWATAYQDLQDAICVAVQSRGVVTEIWAAAGTYKPNRGVVDPLVTRKIAFRLVNGVSIYGGFVGTETLLSQRDVSANPTILSGDIGVAGDDSDNTYHVVDIRDLDPTAILDGFTIRDGLANGAYPHNEGGGIRGTCSRATIRNCRIMFNQATSGGGAILEYGVNGPTFDDCWFEQNSAVGGGAVYCRDADPIFTGTQFHMNEAEFGAAMVYFLGSAGTVTDCIFTHNDATDLAGAVACYQSAPAFTDCEFANNSSEYAGAFDCEDGSSPTLTGCVFTSNESVNGGGAFAAASPGSMPVLTGCAFDGNSGDGGGGAFCIFGAAPHFIDCTFSVNMANAGAAAYHYDADPIYDGCTFTLNVAGTVGTGIAGAMANLFGAAPTVRDCVFLQNSAGCCAGAVWNDGPAGQNFINCRFVGNSSAFGGGAFYNSGGSAATLVNCDFTGNTTPQGDGAAVLNITGAAGTLVNCTIVGNTTPFGGSAVSTDGGSPTLTNCILWGNANQSGTPEAAQIATVNGAAVIGYSIVQNWSGSLGGVGNNGANPLFVDPDGADNTMGTLDDNVRLTGASPAIDAGQNAAVPSGVTTDAAGAARFVDACVADTGVGTPPIVDRGAYEFQGNAGDLNGDGDVTTADIPDFVNVLLGVDTIPPHVVAADVNCDGLADGRDVKPFTVLLLAP